MGDLTFISSLCLAFSSFSRGGTWLRARDRATRESRKTETARPFRTAGSLRRGSHASWESPRRWYSSAHVDASEMSSVGNYAKHRNDHMAVPFDPPAEDPDAGDDRRSFSRSGCCSRLHGWIPMAVDGTSAPGAKNFPLPVSPASGDPDRHSSRMRLRRQNSCSGRGAALRLPSARLWRLRLCFVFPAMNGSPSQRGTAPQDGERQCAISPNSP
jgi:hypothetical protein